MSNDNDYPLVSVVTPSFNQGKYLEDTIQSVLAQDYPSLEYLIVDGGSTDTSVDIIQKHSADLAWWVSEPDEGQASAINKGMAQSKGEIVAWLNSDDLYFPGAVKSAVDMMLAEPQIGMVYGNAVTIDEKGRPIRELIFPNWKLEDLIQFRIICQPSVFMRRSSYEKVSGLDLSYHFMLDHHLWIRIARQSHIKHVAEIWSAARHHMAAKNVSHSSGFGTESLRLLEWMETEPDLAAKIAQNKGGVFAGAYRLNGRYLLDGGEYANSLKAYIKAFLYQPSYAIRHWHRMLYALLAMMGVRNMDTLYGRYLDARRPDLSSTPNLDRWPGLCLDWEE
jgi:glycosyltransferase involved in cell wall biosynthesis